jgi:flagellar basal body-associated protein FliL
MTTSDKKKIVLLVLLVAVGAALYVWLYRSTGAKPAEARAAKDSG